MREADIRRAALIVAVLLGLSACGGDDGGQGDGNAGTSATETTGSTTPAVSSGSPIPFAIGNTWDYRIEYADPVGTVIYSQEVTTIEPGEDGDDVTLRVDYHFENASQPDFGFDVIYTVHPDGSLSVPVNAFAIGDVRFLNEGTEGAVVWPSLEGIRSGENKQGEFTATITSPQLGDVEADYTYNITGAGSEDVSVEAGDFPDAALMNVEIHITTHVTVGGPVEQTVTAQIWFAEDIGLVLHEAQGGAAPGTVTELISTNVNG